MQEYISHIRGYEITGVRDTSDFLSGLLIVMDIIFAERSEKREDGEVLESWSRS